MNRSIKVDSFARMRKRKLPRAPLLEQGVRPKPEAHIAFDRAEDLVACLTRNCLRIIKAVRRKALSVSELAAHVERNRSSVQRDLRVLHCCGLVKITKRTNPGHGMVHVVRAVANRFTVTAQV
jgi:predicted transcriptional regulator